MLWARVIRGISSMEKAVTPRPASSRTDSGSSSRASPAGSDELRKTMQVRREYKRKPADNPVDYALFLVTRHRESKYINRHILAMAEFYEELAVEYVDANPPESLHFDPVRFQELIEATSRLYEVVAGQDGKPEKLEAARKLEAFLAFALRVDRDRFMP